MIECDCIAITVFMLCFFAAFCQMMSCEEVAKFDFRSILSSETKMYRRVK